MDNAFKYVQANGGIDTEESYPYEADVRKIYKKNPETKQFPAVLREFVHPCTTNEWSQTLRLTSVDQDGTCRYKPASVGAKCTGFVDVTQYDEDALKEAVATIGPVSIGIDASQSSFQLYSSGDPHFCFFKNSPKNLGLNGIRTFDPGP